MKTSLARSFLVLALAGARLIVHGQPSPFVPQTLPLDAPGLSARPQVPSVSDSALPPSGDEAVLAPVLKGLLFLSDRNAVRREGVKREDIESVALPFVTGVGFEHIGARYLGQPITLRQLNQLTHDLVVFYREHDHPIVDVLVPEQDISSGVVQVLVLDGKLGRVRAEGNLHFPSELLTNRVRTQPGEAIQGSALFADLKELNQNPFRRVDLVFVRGWAG